MLDAFTTKSFMQIDSNKFYFSREAHIWDQKEDKEHWR